MKHGRKSHCTLPLLFSTHIAFFFWSMRNGPATTDVMVEGGRCRKPGPSLSGIEGLEGIGRTSEEIVSPGRTRVSVAMGLFSKLFAAEACQKNDNTYKQSGKQWRPFLAAPAVGAGSTRVPVKKFGLGVL